VYDHINVVQSSLVKLLIRLEHERAGHDPEGVRQHAVLGDDGVAFDTAAATFIH
jgi:hypothetical protein